MRVGVREVGGRASEACWRREWEGACRIGLSEWQTEAFPNRKFVIIGFIFQKNRAYSAEIGLSSQFDWVLEAHPAQFVNGKSISAPSLPQFFAPAARQKFRVVLPKGRTISSIKWSVWRASL